MVAAATSGSEGGSTFASFAERETEEEGRDYGGDDDGVPDDVPIDDELLVAGWNPGTKRTEDRGERPKDDLLSPLPDPDPALVAFAAKQPLGLPPDSLASRLQGSPEDLLADAEAWARAAAAFLGPSVEERLIGRLLVQRPPGLQDPHGRWVNSRIRVGALAGWALVAKAEREGHGAVWVEAVARVLSLAAGRAAVEAFSDRVLEEVGEAVPLAAGSLSPHLPPQRGEVGDADPGLQGHLAKGIRELIGWGPRVSWVPLLEITEAPIDHDDDPLGLDEIMGATLGEAPSTAATIYEIAFETTQKLSAEIARVRVALAGAALVGLESADRLGARVPSQEVLRLLEGYDHRTKASLDLMVEVAKFATKQKISAKGLRNGLLRAARELETDTEAAIGGLAGLLAGSLVGEAHLASPQPPIDDALTDLFREGRWNALIRELSGASPRVRLLAEWVSGRVGGSTLEGSLAQAREAENPLDRALWLHLAGSAAVHEGNTDLMRSIAAELEAIAETEGHGLAIADAGLLAAEASPPGPPPGDPQKGLERTLRSLKNHGASSAVALVVRWSPPGD